MSRARNDNEIINSRTQLIDVLVGAFARGAKYFYRGYRSISSFEQTQHVFPGLNWLAV
jgi:hypothetical protein